MNSFETIMRDGQCALRAIKVLELVSRFREAHEELHYEIRGVYPIGSKVRLDYRGEKFFATVARYILPLDGGLVLCLSDSDFARFPEFRKCDVEKRHVTCEWAMIDGPVD